MARSRSTRRADDRTDGARLLRRARTRAEPIAASRGLRDAPDRPSVGGALAERLSRVTSSGELIPEIDGFRFLAISSVIAFHLMVNYMSWSGRSTVMQSPAQWLVVGERSWILLPAFCGFFGVQLFFVISGFVLALPFARRMFAGLPAPGLRSYYLRRVTRIEPPYVLCLVVCFLQVAHRTGEAVGAVPHLLASLVYGHGLVYGEGSLINGVAWSLEIEIQFYVLVPLLVWTFAIESVAARRALFVALIAAFALLSQWYIEAVDHPRLRLSLLNYVQYFFAGFLLADVYLTRGDRWARSAAWDVATLLAAAAIPLVLIRHPECSFLLPFVVLLLYAGFFRGRAVHRFITARWIVIAGGMCYTFYLYHALLVVVLMKRTIVLASPSRPLGVDFLLQCLLIYPVIFVVCSLLFVSTEKPFMRWSRAVRRVEGA